MDALLNLRLDAPLLVVAVWAAAAVLATIVLLVPLGARAHRMRLAVVGLVTGVVVAAVVLGVAALLVDVLDIFGGAPVTWAVRGSVAGGLGLLAAALVALCAPRRWRPGVWRRTAAGLLVVVAILAGAIGVNADYGSVRTPAQLFPVPVADPTEGGLFPAKVTTSAMPVSAAEWTPPASLPAAGTVVRVEIPAPVSGFVARPATIYLPPAALVPDPPTLPVLVILSGQPGDTTDILYSGQFQQVLDQYAAAHGGLAPIVVTPDQLTSPDNNPMCMDGAAGNSKTYLQVDVPRWIEQHLNVASDRRAWSFGGYSQGGTCTLQIGLDQPDRYGTNVAISPELTPTIGGNPAATLQDVFHGDQAAYDAITPMAVLRGHTPYRDTVLLMGVGENDATFTAWGNQLAEAARTAGVTVQQFVSPGTTHDFNTVRYTLEQSLPVLMQRAGVTA